jgi:hypothetical protein
VVIENDELDIAHLFSDSEEKKLGVELSKKYLTDYVIESISDKNTLKQVSERFDNRVRTKYKEDDDIMAKNIMKIMLYQFLELQCRGFQI